MNTVNSLTRAHTHSTPFYPEYLKLGLSINACLLLAQVKYWTVDVVRRKSPGRKGWFYKTHDEWHHELGMSRKVVDKARKQLEERGYIATTLKGVPATLWWRFEEERLVADLDALYEAEDASLPQGDNPVCPKGTNLNVRKGQSITENTTETTDKDYKPDSGDADASPSPAGAGSAFGNDGADAPNPGYRSLRSLHGASPHTPTPSGDANDTDQPDLLAENEDSAGCRAERGLSGAGGAHGPAKPKYPSCPDDAILDLWAKHLPGAQQPRRGLWVGSPRQRKLHAAWKLGFKLKNARGEALYSTQDEGVAFWEGLFEHIAANCSFLTRGHRWFGIEWVCTRSKFENILEGKYDDNGEEQQC